MIYIRNSQGEIIDTAKTLREAIERMKKHRYRYAEVQIL